MKQAEVGWLGALLGLVIFWINSLSALAASGDEHWDSTFGVPGAYGGVYNAGCGTAAIFKNCLYINGDFDYIGGSNIFRFAKWDGTNWSPVGSDVNGTVYNMAASEKYLYVCGAFTSVGGMAISNFARWDGTNWSALGELGSALYGWALAMVADEGNVYVGGSFTLAGQSNIVRLAQWNGTNWRSLGAITNYDPYCGWCGDNASVSALALKGHELYVGVYFVYAVNTFANNIAKWDGTNWHPLGSGVNSSVLSIATIGDDVYIAGNFTKAGDSNVNYIARWNNTNWNDLHGGANDATVEVLTINGNDLYAAGVYNIIGGVNAKHIARWDGYGWSPLGSGFGGSLGPARSMVANGTELFVAGKFKTVGGKLSTNIALWHIPHALSTSRSNDVLRLSWPSTGTNFLLESCASLPATNWIVVPQSPAILGRELVVTQEICTPRQFYRLRRK